jgi:hypothetical protein
MPRIKPRLHSCRKPLNINVGFSAPGEIIEAECSVQPTANSQQPTANSQQPTANSQQPTANSQQLTANS